MNSFASFQSMPSSMSPGTPSYGSSLDVTSSVKSTGVYKSSKPSISVHQAEGGSMVLHTSGWAGVGLVFDGRSNDGFALVKEVLANGSAGRDGTITVGTAVSAVDGRTTEGMGYQAIRDTILGPVGSSVVLAVRKAGSTSFQDVVLTRASTEFWALSDANKRMKEKLDGLNRKLRDCELLATRQQTEVDSLRAQRTDLDKTIEKLRAQLAEEKAARKRFESEAMENARDKKDLEEGMEALLKKVSDTTLNFKTAERLARDMTEKARDSEQRKNNEEQLRRMAEEREAAIKAEMMGQTAARRELEKLLDSEKSKSRDYDQQVKNAAELEQAFKQLQHHFLAERADAQTHLALTSTTGVWRDKEKKLAIAEDTVKKLREEIDALKKQIEGEKQNVEAQKKMNARISEEKNQIERALDSANRGKASAQAASENADARANMLTKQLRDKEATIKGMEAAGEAVKAEARQAVRTQDDVKRAAAEEAGKAAEIMNQVKLLKQQLESEKQARAAEKAKLHDSIDMIHTKEAATSRELKLAIESASQKMAFEKDQTAEARQLEAKAAAAAAETKTKLDAALLSARQTKAEKVELEEKVKTLTVALEEARDSARRAQMTAEGLQKQMTPLLEEMGAKELEAISAKGVAKAAEEELAVQQRRAREAAEEAAKATKQLADVEKRHAAKANEADGLRKTVTGLEAQLEEAASKVKEALEWEPKVKPLEAQLAVMQPDLYRLKAAEAKQLQEVKSVAKKYEALNEEWTSTKLEMTNRHDGEMRELRNQLFVILEERNYLHSEVQRFSALPNPVGVGLQIDEMANTTVKGEKLRGFRVSKIQQGLSADLSGVILVGDELLGVNEYSTKDLRLSEIQNLVAGNRGTHVSLDFRRRGQQSGAKSITFRVMLKRGAWGPQHAVVSPEDLDMLDKGRWPEPGSVTEPTPDMAKMVQQPRSGEEAAPAEEEAEEEEGLVVM